VRARLAAIDRAAPPLMLDTTGSAEPSQERISELETALRGLVARVDRAGGYASPEEQDVLRRARQVLAGAGLRDLSLPDPWSAVDSVAGRD